MANFARNRAAALESLRRNGIKRRESAYKDLQSRIGQKFGKLILLEVPEYDYTEQVSRIKLKWECSCGEVFLRPWRNVKEPLDAGKTPGCNQCAHRAGVETRGQTYSQDLLGTRRGRMTITEIRKQAGVAQCDCGRSQKISLRPFLTRNDHCCYECKKARGMGEQPLKKVELTEAEQKQLDRILESRAKWFTKAAMAEVRTDAIRCIVRDRHPEMQYMLCHGGKDPLV